MKGISEGTVSPLAPFVSQIDGISKLKRIEQPDSPTCSLSKPCCTGPERASKITKITQQGKSRGFCKSPWWSRRQRREREAVSISVLTYWRLEKSMVLTSCLAFKALMFYWRGPSGPPPSVAQAICPPPTSALAHVPRGQVAFQAPPIYLSDNPYKTPKPFIVTYFTQQFELTLHKVFT